MQQNRQQQRAQKPRDNTQPVRSGKKRQKHDSKLVQWVLDTGIVSNPKHAEYVLLGCVVVALLIAVYVFFF